MEKITAILMSLLTTLSLFLGMSGSADYEGTTGLKAAIDAILNKNEIMNTRYVGEISEYKWNADDKYSLDDTVILKKEKGKDFTILNLTDTHFADYDIRAFMAFSATAKIKALVAETKPDLITVSGDIVCSESTYYAIRRFTDLMESFGIPWAPVFGNHDDEANCDLNFLADIMMSAPNCVMQKGDAEMGVGNYIINIAEENDDGTLNVVESLIMMDSHKSQANEKQVAWYKWAADGINQLTDNSAEISLIFHIPLPEYQYAYDLAWNSVKREWNEGFDAYGECNEKICCERDSDGNPVQRGFFDAIKESSTAKYIFCGHEHLNNFSILYEGIRLTYTMKVGQASGYDIRFNGGTEITVGENGITRIQQKTAAFGPIITIEDIIV